MKSGALLSSWAIRLLLAAAVCAHAMPLLAHEVRPAYLEITESTPSRFVVLLKLPQVGEQVFGLAPVWPDRCIDASAPSRELLGHFAIERRLVDCRGGLAGQRIKIDGLATTMTDVLVRIQFLDGRVQTELLKPTGPVLVVAERTSAWDVAASYFALGVEHILTGVDHLLFVLGLMLIVKGGARLVKTVTAFTVAHSITLALATLGIVHVAQAPVEAVIALSIVFVATEIAQRHRRGAAVTSGPGFTARRPWLVAFVFGLLHGLGFAGALAEVWLPQVDIPLALLTFNVGVEAGQLSFIAAVLVVMALARRIRWGAPHWLAPLPSYAIGTLAMFWVIQRVATF
ncbi:HupE/UreJ family protein [Paraburkholderia sp. RCC_158]|uniref:HupE/UreJ family protein n=1 Tax=Paraburkholderia sp. RCC_158 TaxID=3239220 RepID=UPI003525B827